jgi:ketosteroid isomerase-like protein
MYARAISWFVRDRFAAMSRGDTARVLKQFADDAHFRYAGRHELAADLHNKKEIAAWFDRAWSLFRFEFEVHDVTVAGPPWNFRLATRFSARMTTSDGQSFLNRGMQYGRVRWGKVRADYVYPDTQVVADALAHARRLAATGTQG